MKYEDWIKYEESRLSQVPLHIRVSLPAKPAHRPIKKANHLSGDHIPDSRLPKMLQRTWTLIVQLFNSLLLV